MKKYTIILIILLLSIYSLFYNKEKEENKEEKSIVFNLTAKPHTLDAHVFTEVISMQLHYTINEAILRTNDKGEYVGGIVSEFYEDKENNTFNFKIRKNAKWSDGSAVTVDDIIFGLRRVLNPKTAARNVEMLFSIKNAEKYYNNEKNIEEVGIEKINNEEFRIILEKPTPYFKYILTLPVAIPLKESFYLENEEDYASDHQHILMNGPYIIESMNNDEINLVKNPYYWNAKNIHIDRIKYLTISDFRVVESLIKNEELDASRIETQFLKKHRDEGELDTYVNGRIWYLDFNLENEYLQDIEFRKAISKAIDRDVYVKNIKDDGSVASTTIIGNVIHGNNNSIFRDTYPDEILDNPYNEKYTLILGSEEQKKLYEKYKGREIRLLSGNSDPEVKEIQFIQEELRVKLGLKTNVLIVPFKERLALTRLKNYDIVLNTWSPKYDDTTSTLNRWNKPTATDTILWNKKEYENIMNEINNMKESKKRDELSYKAERILLDDYVIAPIYYSVENNYVRKNIKGITRKNISTLTDFTYADIK